MINIPKNSGSASTVTVQYYILGASIGDASAKAAMMNGLINEADYADFHYTNVLWLYQRVSVITYGKEVKY